MVTMEELSYGGVTLEVPSDLCSDISILFDIISPDTWNNCITDEHRESLMNYLPDFPENDLEEKTRTLEMFFMDENFRFGTPLRIFYDYLTKGFFNPKIAKMRAVQKKMMFKEYRFRIKEYLHNTLEETLVRRKRVLDIVSNMPPDELPKIPRLLPNPNKKRNSRTHIEYCTKKRYFRELSAIRAECNDTSDVSDDEIYPEGPGASLNKKQRRQLVGLEGSLPQDLLSVRGTHSSGSLALDLELRITPTSNPLDLTDDHFRAMIQKHRQRRNKHESSVDLDTRGITLQDIITRAQIQTKRPPPRSTMSPLPIEKTKKRIKIKKESPPMSATTSSLLSEIPVRIKSEPGSDSDSSSSSSSSSSATDSDEESIKKEIPLVQPAVKKRLIGKGVKIKLEASSEFSSSHSEDMKDHLSSSASSALPADHPIKIKDEIKVEIKEEPVHEDPVAQQIDNSSELTAALESIGACIAPELTQETHICFFSLIRDIICSTGEQRMTKAQLESSIRVWQESAISPLNEWYCLVPSWVNCLPSAINFLCGHFTDVQPAEFVPYIEYKSLLRVYQWIGAGRDSDGHLEPLANFWLAQKSTMSSDWLEDEVGGKGAEMEESEVIPPPRCYTNWTVQPATHAEKEIYRQQEKIRYEKPHKAFTFRMHGYESVVGPVKGIYTQQTGLNKARGHSLLVPDRPAYVTILSLVRDAVARLPNGEGTRSDICELLKESQYLAPLSSPTAENNLNSVVSGALDRLHYENDPCVKYDTSRKLWIYLHRNRNEEEFERMHHLNGPGSNKSKKPAARRQNRCKVKDPIAIKGPPNVSLDPLTSTAKIEGNQVKLKPEDIAALTKGKLETGVKMDITPQMALSKTPKTITSVKVGGMRGNVGGSSVQTIQVSTAGGVQTIKVALPPGAQTINKMPTQALTKVPTANITKVGSQNLGRISTVNKLSSHSSKGIALSQSSLQSISPVTLGHDNNIPSHHIAGGNVNLSAVTSRAPVVTLTTREASRLPTPSVAQARPTTAATITTQNSQHLQQTPITTQIGSINSSGNKLSGMTNVVNMASVATSTTKGLFSSLGGIKVLQASPQQMSGKGGSSSPVVVNSSTALQQLMGQKMVVSGGKVLVQGGKVIQAISGGMSNMGVGGKQMITGVLPGQQMVTVESLLGGQGKQQQSIQSGVITSIAGSKFSGGNIIQLAGGGAGGGVQRLTLVSSQGQPVQLNAAGTAPTAQRLVLATGPQGVGSTDVSGNKSQVVQTIQTLHAGGNNQQSSHQIAAVAGSTISSSSISTASTTTQVFNTPIVATAAQPTQQRYIQVTGQQQKAFMQGINVGGKAASVLSGGGIRLVGPGTTTGGGGGTAVGGQAPTHGNLITIGGKQVLLTSKPFAQQGQLQQVMLTGGNVKSLTQAAGTSTTGTTSGGGAVVVASGSGGQQIVLPASALQGSHLNLKGLQGLQAFHTLKVIPASQVNTQQRGKPVLARIVSPGAVRGTTTTTTALGSTNILQSTIAGTTIRTTAPQTQDSSKS